MLFRLSVVVAALALFVTFSNVAGQDVMADVIADEGGVDSAASLPIDPTTGAVERPKRQFLAGLALGSLIAHRRPYYGHGYGYPYYGGGYYGGHYPHYHGYGGYYGK